jgi:DNA (cytosine-5)-methyltransferase 1
MKVADFFCGAGGFSEGFRQKGFNVVFALDNWKPAIETHHLNHPESNSVLMNILELDTPEKIDKIVPDTEVIVGSPPCISFSNSN